MSLDTWIALFIACWVISLSPGAGAIASMSAGLHYGFWRGYWNAIGLQLALLLQIAIVAAGLGAVLATSELAFGLIKWFGVAYLVYLGLSMLRHPTPAQRSAPLTSAPLRRIVAQGFLTNVLNPKVALFFLAFLPQFVSSETPLAPQLVLLGGICVALNTFVDVLAVLGADRLLRSSAAQASRARILNYVSGSTMVALGVFLATARRSD